MNFKRITIYFVAIVMVLINLFINTSNAEAKSVSSKSNQIYYSIARDVGNQYNGIENYQSNSQVVENFTINFFTDEDSQKLKSQFNDDRLYTVTLDTSKNDNNIISFYPKDLFPDSLVDEKVELAIFPDESSLEAMEEASKKDNEFIPRSISTNYFLNYDNLERQYFGVIRSSIYVYDEYNSNRTRKRHFYQAYHNRTDGYPLTRPAWGGTTNFDNTPDTIALAWNRGGDIGLYDSSIQIELNYNFAYPTPMYATLNKNDSRVSRHNTAFTGNSIAYNVPDYVRSGLDALFPGTQRIQSNTGWYNVGGYNGANGRVRTELFHTYYNVRAIITPNITTNNVSFSISNERTDRVDKMWVYATVNPN